MSTLRSGYTTGACAAAASKAAAELLLTRKEQKEVTIPFPDGTRVTFQLSWSVLDGDTAQAAVIKDGGDDPDVTNGALIVSRVRLVEKDCSARSADIDVIGGKGVGTVTKPGLAVPIGQPAINPVPLRMIREAVQEITEHYKEKGKSVEVCIVVPEGEALAEKTLNRRLGVIGGISILGTTGIVRPVSAEAWTATITASLDVAEAVGVEEIIISTGRTSERSIEAFLAPPEEALIMMGDYLWFTLNEIKKYHFKKVHVATMWGKLLKGAMKYRHTHVKHGALAISEVIGFLETIGMPDGECALLKSSNTARELLERMMQAGQQRRILQVCSVARDYYQSTCGVPVIIHLVDGSGEIICTT